MSLRLQNTQRCRRKAVSFHRNTSLNASGVGLKLQMLEELLCDTIQPHCSDEELKWRARHHFRGLVERELSPEDIYDILIILHEVLSSRIPPKLVSSIHSMIGLLYLTENEAKLAIQSFTKALWVETTMLAPEEADVGLVLQRLAVCRTRLGDVDAAIFLFAKALKLHKESPLKNNHSYIRHAKQELDEAKENIRRASSLRTIVDN
jgi:tetratricopeptide (TPR) repeat protein